MQCVTALWTCNAGTSSLPVRESTEMSGDVSFPREKLSLRTFCDMSLQVSGKQNEPVEMTRSILPKIETAGHHGVGVALDVDDVSRAKCLLLQAFLQKTRFQSSYMNLSLGKLSQSSK